MLNFYFFRFRIFFFNSFLFYIWVQGADLYLQSVPVYEDIDWAGKTHRGIPMRKVASSFK